MKIQLHVDSIIGAELNYDEMERIVKSFTLKMGDIKSKVARPWVSETKTDYCKRVMGANRKLSLALCNEVYLESQPKQYEPPQNTLTYKFDRPFVFENKLDYCRRIKQMNTAIPLSEIAKFYAFVMKDG